jgi:hypothetical protein
MLIHANGTADQRKGGIMLIRNQRFIRAALVVLISAITVSWHLQAQAMGKGIGKGKGHAVAGVSYHCLGVDKQAHRGGSTYSYFADSVVLDAGDQSVMLEGAATSDLVVSDAVTVPKHMAGASVMTDALTLQPFDICGTSAESILNAVVVGVDKANPDTSGSAYVQFVFNLHAKLEFQKNGGTGGAYSALTETTLQVLGLGRESFKVSANGALVEAPPGVTVTDLSTEDHFVYEVEGKHVVDAQLYYGKDANGEDVKNIVQTTFAATGSVTGLDIGEAQIVAGFASAEALNTLTYEIVSLDPSISFSFQLPPEETGDDTGSDIAP